MQPRRSHCATVRAPLGGTGANSCRACAAGAGNKAARAISDRCEAEGVRCCVVGVPKSIDNDLLLVSGGQAKREAAQCGCLAYPAARHCCCTIRAQIDQTFGFETAVQEAQRALLAAKVRGAWCVHSSDLSVRRARAQLLP